MIEPQCNCNEVQHNQVLHSGREAFLTLLPPCCLPLACPGQSSSRCVVLPLTFHCLAQLCVCLTASPCDTGSPRSALTVDVWQTHIQTGTIPPGGMTHGSDLSKLCVRIRSPEIFRNASGIPLRRT